MISIEEGQEVGTEDGVGGGREQIENDFFKRHPVSGLQVHLLPQEQLERKH